ncbi:MAG: hypothetical protein F6K18_15925 [Okeania sp. SIO2C2]|uniref:hypothetical protein n=1 Tax=Okeania sp. SIO2C2 TaxID=2607787 RepID=UPI0013BBF8BB|nr:hypothetical protein [Okeania sp. SIO2C2]NEP88198.1 hypothetical protein [Okeania sp. SIO2C2]
MGIFLVRSSLTPFDKNQQEKLIKSGKQTIHTPKNLPQHGSWQHTINKNPKFRAAIFEILADYTESPFWELIDRQKTLNTIKTVGLNMPQMISTFGLMTIFFKLHNIEIPQKALFANSSGFKTEDNVIIKDVKSGKLFNFNQDKKNRLTEKFDSNIKPIIIAREAIALIPGGENTGELSFEGFVDSENSNFIPGWVWCLDFPFMQLTVEVLENGRVIDRIVAGQFRGDLKKAGKGNGHHAFRYDSKSKPVESLRFRVMDTAFELKKSGGRK